MTCGAPDWSVIVGPAKGLVCLTASKSRRKTSENPHLVANQNGPEMRRQSHSGPSQTKGEFE